MELHLHKQAIVLGVIALLVGICIGINIGFVVLSRLHRHRTCPNAPFTHLPFGAPRGPMNGSTRPVAPEIHAANPAPELRAANPAQNTPPLPSAQ